MIDKLDNWHQTRVGFAVFAVVELLIADGFFSLSIDRGNFFWYILTLIFLVGALQNIVKFIGSFIRGKR